MSVKREREKNGVNNSLVCFSSLASPLFRVTGMRSEIFKRRKRVRERRDRMRGEKREWERRGERVRVNER